MVAVIDAKYMNSCFDAQVLPSNELKPFSTGEEAGNPITCHSQESDKYPCFGEKKNPVKLAWGRKQYWALRSYVNITGVLLPL